MLVSVVEIRGVRVRVRHGSVFVRVRMAYPSRQAGMHVVVVTVVVPVAVCVR